MNTITNMKMVEISFSLPSARDQVEEFDHVVDRNRLGNRACRDVVSPILAKGFAGRFQTQAPLGPDANDELIDSLNMLSERLGMENMATLMDKYVPPNNIPQPGSTQGKPFDLG